METWKKLSGYDHDYEISDHGRIRNSKTNKILKLQREIRKSDGYIRVRCNLIKNNKNTKLTLARLVLSIFNPIHDSSNYHVDHIDFDPTNNSLQNLRWLSPEENNKNKRSIKYYEAKLAEKENVIKELQSKIKILTALNKTSFQSESVSAKSPT